MDERTERGSQSFRQVVLAVVEHMIDRLGAPLQFREIAQAVVGQKRTASSRQIYGALDSLTRTGQLSIAGRRYGLRSGGTRLYWPTSRKGPIPVVRAPATLAELVIGCISSEGSEGERTGALSVGSLMILMAKMRGEAPIEITWQRTYAVLRNLERRRSPLVVRNTDRNGHVLWSWLGPAESRRADGNSLRFDKGAARERRTTLSTALRAAGKAVETARGQKSFPIRELLEFAPECHRDAIRSEVRQAIDYAQRHPAGGESITRHQAVAIRVRGWFNNDCYIELGGERVDSAGTLPALRIGHLVEVLQTQWKASERLLLHWKGFEQLARLHYEELFRRRRAISTAIRAFEGRFPISTRLEEIHGASERLQGFARHGRTHQLSSLPSQADGVQWASAEALRTRLCLLLGPNVPSAVLLRRMLRASAVWRRWSRKGHWGLDAAGREPIVWDSEGAILFLGGKFGGRRTRAVLRVAERLLGQGRPSPEVLLDCVRQRSDAAALLAYYAVCERGANYEQFLDYADAYWRDAAEWLSWSARTIRAQNGPDARPGMGSPFPWLE